MFFCWSKNDDKMVVDSEEWSELKEKKIMEKSTTERRRENIVMKKRPIVPQAIIHIQYKRQTKDKNLI